MARIKYKVNCRTCRACKGNPKLRARIEAAYYHRDEGDETLRQIALEIGVAPSTIANHCKQHLYEQEFTPARVETRIERMKAKIAKETELALDQGEILVKQDFEKVIDDVLADGLDQLKKQNKNITVSQLLTAAKIKADYTAKKRGQDAELIKTMYHFARKGANGSGSTPAAPGVD